jgi:hypothetical protein
MDNEVGKSSSNHLEFLGFEVTDVSSNGMCKLSARSTAGPNITVNISGGNVAFFSVRFGGFNISSMDNVEFHQIFQKLNRETMFNRWFAAKNDADNSVIIVIETWCVGYEKLNFGRIIEGFLVDIRKNMPEFAAYAKKD